MSKSSAELRADLAALEAERPALREAIAAGEAAQKKLWAMESRYGPLERLRSNIATAEKAEKIAAQDATARRAVIVQPPNYRPEEWVVQGVTAEWVTTRRAGTDSTRKYSAHDGTAMSRWDRDVSLDIPATFPEGIEAYRKAAKVKK